MRGRHSASPIERLARALLVAHALSRRRDEPPVARIEVRVSGGETLRPERKGHRLRVPALPQTNQREPVPEPRIARLDLERTFEGGRGASVPTGLPRFAGARDEGGDGRALPSRGPPFVERRRYL